jgi:hypothetical protein
VPTRSRAPKHAFPRTPAFAWRPVAGAKKYEFELSTRCYRVRGLNPSLPKKPELTWSSPVRLRVAGPRFLIVRR